MGCGRRSANLALLLAVAGLAACGGSDYVADDSTPAAPDPAPGGFYRGVLTTGAGGFDAVALVSPGGAVRIVVPESQRLFLTDFPAAGSRWQGKLSGFAGAAGNFPDGGSTCSGSIDGSAYAAAELLADYDCGGERGTLQLDFDDQVSYDPPDTAELTGEVQGLLPPHVIVALIIAPDGSFTGSDTAGCSYRGAFAAADPIVNLYDLSLRQRCGTQTLSLSGSAVLDSAQQGQPLLYYGVSDTEHSLAGVLQFQ